MVSAFVSLEAVHLQVNSLSPIFRSDRSTHCLLDVCDENVTHLHLVEMAS